MSRNQFRRLWRDERENTLRHLGRVHPPAALHAGYDELAVLLNGGDMRLHGFLLFHPERVAAVVRVAVCVVFVFSLGVARIAILRIIPFELASTAREYLLIAERMPVRASVQTKDMQPFQN